MRKAPDVPFVNDSGERIPPGALMVPGDEHDEDGAIYVTKPTADSMPGLLVNGEFSVEPDQKGAGTFGPQVALAVAGTPPAAGTRVGSAIGSWLGTTGKFGWVVWGGDDADYGMMNAVRDGTGSPAVSPPVPPPPPGFPSWCGWLAELVNWSALKLELVSAAGMCDCVDLDQVLMLVRNSNPGEWVPIVGSEYPTRLTLCTDDFTVKFISLGCGPPCLELTTTPASGGGTTTRLMFDGCDQANKTVYFRGSGPVFCTGDATPCVGDDTFRVKISCGVICNCDGTYPVPARLHGTFVGGDFTDCIDDGHTYALDYNGSILPGGEQWEYHSPYATGCGPFTGCQPPFFPYGIIVGAVGCFNGPYAVFVQLYGPLAIGPGGGAECPFVSLKEVEGSRTVQCNPLVIEFDLELDTANANGMDLLDTIGTTLPTKMVLTA